MSVAAAKPAAPAPSAFSPFRHTAFTVLWLATVVSNVGTWMNDVGAGWLMTSLAPSPTMVSLVQAATALPVFLFALPAGALADIVDKRRLLIAVQAAMAVAALLMGLVVLTDRMTAPLLLLFTALLGTGAAFVSPAWQAIVPKLVPKEDLQPAIAMNSVGINISRAIGPALGGAIIAGAGLAWPFLLNAVSFVGVLAALCWWRPPAAPARALPPEPLGRAVVTGLRYALASAPLKATLARAVAFFLFASAYWALLPLIARDVLSGGPGLYGVLLGAVGVGAVAGALVLPRLKAAVGGDRLVAGGTVGTAVTLLVFALVEDEAAAMAVSLLAGASWIAVLSNLNVSAQTALPDWVRARGLAVFITVFFGAMTAGSILWGQVASAFGIETALVAAAGGALAGIAVTWPFKLLQGAQLDLAPSMHWPQPVLAGDVAPDRGPVLVAVEYVIDPANSAAFVTAMREVEGERRRDGAATWSLHEDAAEPGRWLETFTVASWLDHQRQHERVTKADREVEAKARAFHLGPEPPLVRHLLAPERRS